MGASSLGPMEPVEGKGSTVSMQRPASCPVHSPQQAQRNKAADVSTVHTDRPSASSSFNSTTMCLSRDSHQLSSASLADHMATAPHINQCRSCRKVRQRVGEAWPEPFHLSLLAFLSTHLLNRLTLPALPLIKHVLWLVQILPCS